MCGLRRLRAQPLPSTAIDTGATPALLHDVARRVVNAGHHDQGLIETACPDRHDQKILNIDASTRVSATAKYLHLGQGQANLTTLR